MADDDGFIGLPPGVAPNPDSGTVRRERHERPRIERGEIVFFPAAPGIAPPMPDAEVASAPAPAAPAPAAPAPEVVAAPDPASSVFTDATRISPRRAAATWRLVIDGQEPITVDGAVFLGRKPVADPAHPRARLVAVDDEAKSVSKTHAMLELDAGALWVHDLHSTNGVWVVPAGEDAIEVTPGTRVLVPPGSELELGDLVVQVEHG